MINSPESYYRSFKIRKRSGGFRRIDAPMPSLLMVQQWILENILNKLRIHPKAFGFVHGLSIVDNARLHAGRRQVLKLDISNFFPSIPFEKIVALLISVGFAPKISWYLARLVCLKGSLPQGAATSPRLSNIICFRMDCRMNGLAQKHGWKYSRYADDITFSGKDVTRSNASFINSIIEGEGFKPHPNKLRFYGSLDRKIITGISVKGRRLRPKSIFRRSLQTELFYIDKYGLQSHISKKKIRKLDYIDVLKGRLAFWEHVSPSDKSLLKSKLIFDRILTNQAQSSD